jgi:hypothetical protein
MSALWKTKRILMMFSWQKLLTASEGILHSGRWKTVNQMSRSKRCLSQLPLRLWGADQKITTANWRLAILRWKMPKRKLTLSILTIKHYLTSIKVLWRTCMMRTQSLISMKIRQSLTQRGII